MLTEHTLSKEHPLVKSISDTLNTNYGESPFSILKEKPYSIIKTGSWVYMDPDKDLSHESDLDLIIVSSNHKQKKVDKKIDYFKDFENPIDLSIINLNDITNRIYNLDFDSVERVSSMSMPSNVIVDNGVYEKLNNAFLNNLFPRFKEFCYDNFAKSNEKEIFVRVPFEEFIVFPIMLDMYKISGLAKSVDNFFDSQIYDDYITEYTTKIKDICIKKAITFSDDSFYLHLNPIDIEPKTFNKNEYLREGVPHLKKILLKQYSTLGLSKEDIKNKNSRLNNSYYSYLEKKNLLSMSHFDKEYKNMYTFNTRAEELIF
jgi:hypothetical protein